jgi:hypothetical protein
MMPCPACGHMLRLQRVPAGGNMTTPENAPGAHPPPAPPADRWLLWQHQQRVNAARYRLGLFLGCLAGYSLILALAPGPAQGPLGWLFLVGAGVSALLTLAGSRRAGRGALARLTLLLVLAAVLVGLLDSALGGVLHSSAPPELLLGGLLPPH